MSHRWRRIRVCQRVHGLPRGHYCSMREFGRIMGQFGAVGIGIACEWIKPIESLRSNVNTFITLLLNIQFSHCFNHCSFNFHCIITLLWNIKNILCGVWTKFHENLPVHELSLFEEDKTDRCYNPLVCFSFWSQESGLINYFVSLTFNVV